MPVVPKSRPSARRTNRKSSTRYTEPQSLLILHLDAEKLRDQKLHMGVVAGFTGAVANVALGSSVTIEDTTSLVDLTEKLATYRVARRTFDVVVVVAHSNTRQIRVASDEVLSWSSFAALIKPLRPRRLLLVACQGGRWDAGECLFQGLPNLRRIFACPVNASRDFGALMLFAVPYVVAKRRPADEHVRFAQLAAVGATGRQLREWRRTDDKGNPQSAIFDVIADLADPVARKTAYVVEKLVKSVFRR